MFLLTWNLEKAKKYIDRALTSSPLPAPYEREAIEWALHQAEVLEKFKVTVGESLEASSQNWAILALIHDLENPKPKGKWEKLRDYIFAMRGYPISAEACLGGIDKNALLDKMKELEREDPQ